MDWILQKDKDIMSEISWETSYFELEMKDGGIVKAWGFIDENGEGEIFEHLEELETGEYNVVDTDDIKRWRIINEG